MRSRFRLALIAVLSLHLAAHHAHAQSEVPPTPGALPDQHTDYLKQAAEDARKYPVYFTPAELDHIYAIEHPGFRVAKDHKTIKAVKPAKAKHVVTHHEDAEGP